MALVDGHRSVHQVGGLAVGVPGAVLPLIAALDDHGRRGRRYLGPEREGICPQAQVSVLTEHFELVPRASPCFGQKQLPHAGTAEHPHRVHTTVPAVEFAHHAHRLGVGGPHRERGARDCLVHPRVRPQVPPQPFMPSLAEQVQVQLSDGGPEPVWILDNHHNAVRVADLQPVVRDTVTGQRGCEQSGGVNTLHLRPLITNQHSHRDRLRPPGPDQHTWAAGRVDCERPAEHGVRVVVQPRGQPSRLAVINGQADIDCTGHADSFAPCGSATRPPVSKSALGPRAALAVFRTGTTAPLNSVTNQTQS